MVVLTFACFSQVEANYKAVSPIITDLTIKTHLRVLQADLQGVVKSIKVKVGQVYQIAVNLSQVISDLDGYFFWLSQSMLQVLQHMSYFAWKFNSWYYNYSYFKLYIPLDWCLNSIGSMAGYSNYPHSSNLQKVFSKLFNPFWYTFLNNASCSVSLPFCVL